MTETVSGGATSSSDTQDTPKGATQGLTLERVFSTAGVHPYDELTWERRDVVQTNWKTGATVFEQRGVEYPDDLVGQRLHDRHHEVLPRRRRHRRARVEPQAAHRPDRAHLHQGRPRPRLLRHPRRRRDLRARAHLAAGQPVLLVQLPGLVQRRHRLAAAGLGLLHPLGRRLDGLDPQLVQGRGLHLQGRLRRRPQPLPHPLLQGAALLRRHRLGPGLLHARRRRLGRHHQVRWRHAPRGQDGRPRRRPPRHRGVRDDQGQGGGQDPRPARRRLRHGPRRRRHHLGAVPERQQLGARLRRVHARRRGRHRLRPARSQERRGDRARRRPRPVPQDQPRPRGPAPTRACSTTTRSTTGTPTPRPAASPRPTRARSTCRSTTPRATSPRSTC